ncbi:hypothetical protein [[Clostridium] fimetarium]|uniref:Uncharacterized protein n=1 Tax=[Clostridium] fimetarium TaxID=99656 RepID=A0A1I0Q1G2_9FIRM|nr:hypothetical protein [[Clostridium] fimetarium]SEW20611.1 hypothetical protein SAMN05421659_106210 [[Clostridium] fimetarium]
MVIKEGCFENNKNDKIQELVISGLEEMINCYTKYGEKKEPLLNSQEYDNTHNVITILLDMKNRILESDANISNEYVGILFLMKNFWDGFKSQLTDIIVESIEYKPKELDEKINDLMKSCNLILNFIPRGLDEKITGLIIVWNKSTDINSERLDEKINELMRTWLISIKMTYEELDQIIKDLMITRLIKCDFNTKVHPHLHADHTIGLFWETEKFYYDWYDNALRISRNDSEKNIFKGCFNKQVIENLKNKNYKFFNDYFLDLYAMRGDFNYSEMFSLSSDISIEICKATNYNEWTSWVISSLIVQNLGGLVAARWIDVNYLEKSKEYMRFYFEEKELHSCLLEKAANKTAFLNVIKLVAVESILSQGVLEHALDSRVYREYYERIEKKEKYKKMVNYDQEEFIGIFEYLDELNGGKNTQEKRVHELKDLLEKMNPKFFHIYDSLGSNKNLENTKLTNFYTYDYQKSIIELMLSDRENSSEFTYEMYCIQVGRGNTGGQFRYCNYIEDIIKMKIDYTNKVDKNHLLALDDYYNISGFNSVLEIYYGISKIFDENYTKDLFKEKRIIKLCQLVGEMVRNIGMETSNIIHSIMDFCIEVKDIDPNDKIDCIIDLLEAYDFQIVLQKLEKQYIAGVDFYWKCKGVSRNNRNELYKSIKEKRKNRVSNLHFDIPIKVIDFAEDELILIESNEDEKTANISEIYVSRDKKIQLFRSVAKNVLVGIQKN